MSAFPACTLGNWVSVSQRNLCWPSPAAQQPERYAVRAHRRFQPKTQNLRYDAHSRPGTAGKPFGAKPGYVPATENTSDGLTGRQVIRTRASPGPGSGTGTWAMVTVSS